MSTIRHRSHRNFNENNQSDSETKEKHRDENQNTREKSNFRGNQSVTDKLENEDSYKDIQNILDEFTDMLKEFSLKTDYLNEQLMSQKKFPRSFLENTHRHNDKRKSYKSEKLPEREFTFTKSLLTELFEIVHIRTLHNVFLVSLMILLLSTAVNDLLESGTTHLGLQTIKIGFGKFPSAFLIWLCSKLSTFSVFYCFKFWAMQYQTNDHKTYLAKMQNFKYLIGFALYIVLLIYLPLKAVLVIDLPIGSSLAVLMEQTRLLMKMYAFVRSNVAKVMSGKAPPDVSKFIYFLFAPTLVYRDVYPRKTTINWKFVIWHFTEVVFVIFYVAFLFERMLIPYFRNYGKEPLEVRTLVLSIFGAMLPGSLLFICGFYLLLHAWMNAWAEMLRFGDRTFYKDWWNVSSYDSFYRTWNIVVHDWLYTYIYKDVYEKFSGKNKTISLLTTFLISAIVHEYLLAFSFRFFYPVLFVSFAGFGVIFVFISRKFSHQAGNLFIWFTICSGNGVVVSLYLIESFARINCPPYANESLDFFIPRSLITCY